jgi:hypothetical protein
MNLELTADEAVARSRDVLVSYGVRDDALRFAQLATRESQQAEYEGSWWVVFGPHRGVGGRNEFIVNPRTARVIWLGHPWWIRLAMRVERLLAPKAKH